MRALMLYDETVRTKKTSTRRDRPPIPDDAFGFIDFDSFSDPWSWSKRSPAIFKALPPFLYG